MTYFDVVCLLECNFQVFYGYFYTFFYILERFGNDQTK